MIDVDKLGQHAIKTHNQTEYRVYKNIQAAIHKNQTAKGTKPLTEEIVFQIILRYIKNLKDAILQFSEAHRDDLVSVYTRELEVVKKLLPEPVNESQIYSELRKYAIKNDFDNMPDFDEGLEFNISIPKKQIRTTIKYLKSKFPTTDDKIISDIVKKYIV